MTKEEMVRRVFSVSQVAELCDVNRHQVFRWLDSDVEQCVFKSEEWFRLPSGHVRIRGTAVARIMGTDK